MVFVAVILNNSRGNGIERQGEKVCRIVPEGEGEGRPFSSASPHARPPSRGLIRSPVRREIPGRQPARRLPYSSPLCFAERGG